MSSVLLSPRTLECHFRSRPWLRALPIALMCSAMVAGLEGARLALASALIHRGRFASLEMALALDPANPEVERKLGLFELYSSEDPNPLLARRYLERAAQLSPRRPFYQSDLALACDALGDFSCADQALSEALNLSPMTPHLYWLAANHDLRAGQPEKARPLFRRLLQLSPSYADATFDICLRALNDPEQTLREVLPSGQNSDLKLRYVDFLAANGREDAARQAWREAATPASELSFALTKPYLEHLIDTGRYENARSVWQDLERARAVPAPEPGNLVTNGGFEQTPLGAGFDWRYQPVPYTSADFEDPGAYRGVRCLRLDFTVAVNREFEPVSQFIPVESGAAYLLTAYVRSERITSDSGPRLRVRDPDCSSCLDAQSSAALGTTGWHPVSLSFSASPRTRIVKLTVWRPRSRSFPAEISGRFWLDDVSMGLLRNN